MGPLNVAPIMAAVEASEVTGSFPRLGWTSCEKWWKEAIKHRCYQAIKIEHPRSNPSETSMHFPEAQTTTVHFS